VLVETYRRRLFRHALDQYGYVTTQDAADLGIPAVELRKLAGTGGIEHIAYGLYRFDDVPRTGRDQFMESVLRVGPDAYLTHDSVLALHELALVNPRRIRIGTPKRARPRLPDYIEVIQRRLEPYDLTIYESIPTTTVARALFDCRGLVIGERLVSAAKEAAARGLLRKGEADRVIADLEATV